MKSTVVTLTLALLAAMAATVPGRAATVDTLTPTPGLVTWAGEFPAETVVTPIPDTQCLIGACHEYTLPVALGDLWDTAEGAVEVAIRWDYDGVIDLDLVVSKDGNEVARSAALDSNAESVFIPDAADGDYTVTVIPTNTINPDTDPVPVPYEALAQVEIFPEDGAGADLLPNLVTLPPANFHIATAANLVPFPTNPLLSCYPEETVERPDHPTRCLRFDQTIANTGAGPLELRFAMEGAASPDPQDQAMLQRIYTDDGGHHDRFADSYELHAVHGHVHYRGFGQSFLYAYDWSAHARIEDPDGHPIVASIGNKVGFCVIDVKLLAGYWGATGNGPRTRTFPTCNFPDLNQSGPDGIWMVQGIDVGWADVYGWNLADQYIDITNVADGIYELEQVANPNGSILEQTRADNVASTVICLRGDAATAVTTDQQAATCLA